MSKKLTLNADNTVTVVDATLGDIPSTMISSNSKLTGVYGFVQSAAFVGIGAVAESKKRGGGFLPAIIGGQ